MGPNPLVMRHTILPGLCGLLFVLHPFATEAQYSQLDLPRESQMAWVTQRIGVTDLSVNYSRPSVKGRVIWGEVVPYGEVWRMGANENTIFSCTHDITVEGQALAAGTYGVHAIPGQEKWTVLFSTDHTAWGSFFHKAANEALRVEVTPRAGTMTEQLTYDLVDVGKDGGTLVMRWEKLEVPVRISVNTHAAVLAYLDEHLHGLKSFAWEVWYEAAHYCHQEGIAPDRAMEWVDKSIARGANFENQTLKARMLEAQGRTAEAAALRTKMIDEATNAQLNTLAYGLMNEGRVEDALKMFQLNAKRHPDDPNVHDSLGEGYMMAGNKEAAIKSFKKSLSMDPPEGVKANSLKCLKKLGVDTSAWETAKS